MMIARSPAQRTTTGQIQGHVVDSTGAAIEGAGIFVRRNSPAEDNVRLVAHTDARGDFILPLPEGGYDVLVTSPGFVSAVETIPVFPGKTRRAQWKMKALGCDLPGVNCDTFH